MNAGATPLRAVGEDRRRVRARVEGTVQGVGFRPFVYRLAGELGLAGWILNYQRGVLLEAEGDPAAIDALLARLAAEAPSLAAVERIATERVPAPRELHRPPRQARVLTAISRAPPLGRRVRRGCGSFRCICGHEAPGVG